MVRKYGVLHAKWGYGSQHDGEHYRVQLCESCFFQVPLYIKQEREIKNYSMMTLWMIRISALQFVAINGGLVAIKGLFSAQWSIGCFDLRAGGTVWIS